MSDSFQKSGEVASELENKMEIAMKKVETAGDDNHIRGFPKGLYFVAAKVCGSFVSVGGAY